MANLQFSRKDHPDVLKQLGFAELWHRDLSSTESALRIQERALASVSSGITIADVSRPDCPLIYCNEAFTTITGYTAAEVLGTNCRFLQGPDTDREAVETIRAAVRAERACKVVFKNYRKDRTPFWNELTLTPVHDGAGKLTHFIGVQHDVSVRKAAAEALKRTKAELELANHVLETRVRERTKALEKANAQLRHDAFHDTLTGLANRALFHDRLFQALEREKRNPRNGFAVLYLDFDRFKVINDSLGHAAGDKLLVAVGERLRGCVRPADTVARLGGDEFTLLLEDTLTPDEAVRVAERIQGAFLEAIDLDGCGAHISVSIGIVSGKVGYSEVEEVMRDADIAMYRAKALGKARHVLFDTAMRERALNVLALENDLRRAVERGELKVHYQPIVAAADSRPTGFEALVRWEHTRHGNVSPAEFIPVAEETGLVIALDRFVLREACEQVAAWQRQFPNDPTLSLSVNFSSQQFLCSDLVAYVKDVLFETGFEAANLHLELTETVMVDTSPAVQQTLSDLKALGLQLHIDDFGTGYSSLSYLQHLPSQTLKIDRSFVLRMQDSPKGEELVHTIVKMAHNLGMTVVAEGVETETQRERLSSLGCEYLQGYLFSRPLPADAVAPFMGWVREGALV